MEKGAYTGMKDVRILLHILLITFLTATFYPLIRLFGAWSGKDNLFSLGLTGVLLLCTWSGTLYMLLFRRGYAKRPRLINGSLWGVTALVFLVCCCFVPFPSNMVRFLYGAIAAGCCFGGARLVFHPLEHLAHPYVFAGLCIWHIFIGVLLYLNHAAANVLFFVIIFICNAALFAVVHNGNAMEQMLLGRDDEVWEMPQEMRRSNRKLMGILCGSGVLLLLSYRFLAKGLRWLWRWIYTGLWYGLRRLLSFGSSAEQVEAPENPPEQLMELPQNTQNVWIRLVIELVFGVGILVLVIWKRREIGTMLAEGWCAFRRWVGTHLRKNHAAAESGSSGAYCDYVEDLLTSEPSQKNIRMQFRSRHRWNQAYRRYRHMPFDCVRYRLGYALALACLPEEIAKPSDSPVEILTHLQKSGETIPAWEMVTEAYCQARYGEMKPNREAFLALDRVLCELER